MDTTSQRKTITLTFNIVPVACARPRLSKFGVYTPKKTADYKKAVAKLLQQNLQNNPSIRETISGLYERPVCLIATFCMPIPQRLIKKNSEPWRETLPTTRNDTDNLIKAVKDCLTGVIFHDDSQVTHEFIRKIYSDRPRVELIIYEANVLLEEKMFAGHRRFFGPEVAIIRVGICFWYKVT